MRSDLEIAQAAQLLPITEIARKLAITPAALINYGDDMAKINVDFVDKNRSGKLILVTAINPTKAGEGKSTTTVGLVDGLNRLGFLACGAMREPSLGPVFGIKGGATGGGFAQVLPMEAINLHFTGDMHAITTANNLISAMIDNHIYHGNALELDINRIVWKRCLDLNDRALRVVNVGLGEGEIAREDKFQITVASEIMAILCLSSDMEDFKQRVGNCLIGYNINGDPVFVKQLRAVGAVAAIMKQALLPNLVQTLEHNPVIIHGGPFANIAHGCNSLIATRTALNLADYVVTEAGFGADLGAEKFLDIKCRVGKLNPALVVIVATIRALKLHGNCSPDNLNELNLPALKVGVENLAKHIDTIKQFKLPLVVAINRFANDHDEELQWLLEWCQSQKVPAELSEGWASGGAGMELLAKQVVKLTEQPVKYECLYDLNTPIDDKIETICKKVYGANQVIFSAGAIKDMENIIHHSWDKLPICMAKTPLSLSDNPKLRGSLGEFAIHVEQLEVSLGAGFIVVKTGKINTMPGLSSHPAAFDIDVINDKIVGLF